MQARKKFEEISQQPMGTLDEALAAIDAFKDMLDTMIEAIEEQAEELEAVRENLEAAEEKVAELEGAAQEATEVLQYHVGDIEGARQHIKAGNTSEAVYQLERVLQEVDPTCTRTNVVVPRLPAAGSFGF